METHKRSTTDNFSWNIMLFCGVLIYGSHGVLLNISKVDGKIPFNSASVVFFIELSKLFISMIIFLPQAVNGKAIIIPTLKQFLVFSIPAFLYSINNNIVVHILGYMDPASFQVLSNLKIVCTALLYRIILNRPISMNKWIAFIMITIAGAFNSYGGWLSSFDVSYNPERKNYVTFLGTSLVLLYCFISGTAAVYTEYILKKETKLSFAVQSMMMYIFGTLINSGVFLVSNVFLLHDNNHTGVGELFKGYSIWTIIIIFTQALNGVIIGAVMKHASNLTRLILVAGAMLVSISLSVIIFNIQFNFYFTVAFLLVLFAMYVYYQPDIKATTHKTLAEKSH